MHILAEYACRLDPSLCLEYDLTVLAGIACFALPGIPFPMFDRLYGARIVGI